MQIRPHRVSIIIPALKGVLPSEASREPEHAALQKFEVILVARDPAHAESASRIPTETAYPRCAS